VNGNRPSLTLNAMKKPVAMSSAAFGSTVAIRSATSCIASVPVVRYVPATDSRKMNEPSRFTAVKMSAARSWRRPPPYVLRAYEAVIASSKKT
jgi:hypothetical protein